MDRTIPDVRLPALSPNLAAAVRRAVGHLIAGGVVIAPTESSYGLFASVRRAEALEHVLELKGRSAGRPLPLVVPGQAGLLEVAREPGDAARVLMHHFWPGPLTVVLDAREGLHDAVHAGTRSVGLRVPSHPVAAALCAAAGPLTATSANREAQPAPLRVDAIDEALLSERVLVVDGGEAGARPASTVVRVSEVGRLEVLREGPISRAQIQAVLGL